jgi:hypothetical protein
MADLEEVEIEIVNRGTRKYTTLPALLSQRASCNIIERACLEELRRPWTRCESGITYDFSDHASPPLGQCEFPWSWKGCSATASAVFIVVEKVEGTACRIILGPSARQKPVVPAANDALTFTTSKRTKGMLSSLFHSCISLTIVLQRSRTSTEKECDLQCCGGLMRRPRMRPG